MKKLNITGNFYQINNKKTSKNKNCLKHFTVKLNNI